MKLYLDTCVWLNLFKREKNYWKATKKILIKYDKIYLSTIVLKELYFAIPNVFTKIVNELKKDKNIIFIKTKSVDYDLARKFEIEHGFLSFYDYLHISISMRNNFILVTRDKDLFKYSFKKIKVKKPEDLI